MAHPTICHHVVDWDSITALSSLSLQFFTLVSGRIPQLHILTNLYQMMLPKKLLLLLLSKVINPLMLELNPSVQRCLTRFFTGDFAS
jgi:hypothetical protein